MPNDVFGDSPSVYLEHLARMPREMLTTHHAICQFARACVYMRHLAIRYTQTLFLLRHCTRLVLYCFKELLEDGQADNQRQFANVASLKQHSSTQKDLDTRTFPPLLLHLLRRPHTSLRPSSTMVRSRRYNSSQDVAIMESGRLEL